MKDYHKYMYVAFSILFLAACNENHVKTPSKEQAQTAIRKLLIESVDKEDPLARSFFTHQYNKIKVESINSCQREISATGAGLLCNTVVYDFYEPGHANYQRRPFKVFYHFRDNIWDVTTVRM